MDMKTMIMTIISVTVAVTIIATVLIPVTEEFSHPEGYEEYYNGQGQHASVMNLGETIEFKKADGKVKITTASGEKEFLPKAGYLFACNLASVIYDGTDTLTYHSNTGIPLAIIGFEADLSISGGMPRITLIYEDSSSHTTNITNPTWCMKADPYGEYVSAAPSETSPVYSRGLTDIASCCTVSTDSATKGIASYYMGALAYMGSGSPSPSARFTVSELEEDVKAVENLVITLNNVSAGAAPYILAPIKIIVVGEGGEPTMAQKMLEIIPILTMVAVIMLVLKTFVIRGGDGGKGVLEKKSGDSYDGFA